MAKYGPSSAFLLVNGYNISSDTFVLEDAVEQVLEEAHGLGESWEKSYPVQLAKVTLTASGGLYDDETIGAALQESNMSALALRAVDFGHHGITIGNVSTLLYGSYAAKWKRIASRDALTKAHAEHTVTGRHIQGRIIHALSADTSGATGNNQASAIDQSGHRLAPAAVTVTSSTAATDRIVTATAHGLTTGDQVVFTGHTGSTPSLNGSSGYLVVVVDATTFTLTNFAAAAIDITVGGTGGTVQRVSSRGGYANLQLTGLTLGGYTNYTATLRHSYDNSTWADVTGGAFTARTAVGAEQITIPTTTVIRRYTAMAWAFAGAGSGQSATPYIALARN